MCRSGGRIGLTTWVPEGFIGQMFMTIGQHAPPPPGVDPPILWGKEERLRELFGDGISDLSLERHVMVFRFRSFDHWLDFFRTYLGPMKMAFARVGPDGERALADDLRGLVERFDRGGGRAMLVDAEYAEVVAVRA